MVSLSHSNAHWSPYVHACTDTHRRWTIYLHTSQCGMHHITQMSTYPLGVLRELTDTPKRSYFSRPSLTPATSGDMSRPLHREREEDKDITSLLAVCDYHMHAHPPTPLHGWLAIGTLSLSWTGRWAGQQPLVEYCEAGSTYPSIQSQTHCSQFPTPV